VACGLRFFSTKPLGGASLSLHLPPRTALSQLPQGLRVEALPRLCTSTQTPRHRVRLMTTSAAGLRGSAGVRLQLPAMASERGLIRVAQGKGRQERSTLRSTRLLTALRASWRLYRPAPWWVTGLDPHAPMPLGTAPTISYHTQRTAGSTHGHGSPPLRHGFATHRLEAGVDVRTIQRWLGPQGLETTTRYLRITRQPRATIRSPFALLPWGDPPQPTPESSHAAPCRPMPPPAQRRQPGPRPALHGGKSPISSASMASQTAVPLPYRPHRRR
jgi:integrase